MNPQVKGVGKPRAAYAEQQRSPAFTRYLADRMAGHMVVLSPSMDQRFDEQNDEAGARLHALTSHLVTQHPGTHYETIKRYHVAPYADSCGPQSGHRNAGAGGQRSRGRPRDSSRRANEVPGTKPAADPLLPSDAEHPHNPNSPLAGIPGH